MTERPDTDRIEKTILLRAPRARVWRALTDPVEFGTWFGVKMPPGSFTPGAKARGVITNAHPGYENLPLEIEVQEMEPERLFSWRWHPGAVEPPASSGEPTTLVEFILDDVEGGTMVTLIESGFDRISLARRAAAFEDNSKGWDFQMNSLAEYVGKTA